MYVTKIKRTIAKDDMIVGDTFLKKEIVMEVIFQLNRKKALRVDGIHHDFLSKIVRRTSKRRYTKSLLRVPSSIRRSS